MVTQQGPTVEMKTRRPFFLDCPKDYKPGDKVNVLLSLHGGGSYGNWQRNYFPAFVGLSYGSSIMIGIALEIASFPASFFKLVKEFLVDD